jgi:hypothetical protein
MMKIRAISQVPMREGTEVPGVVPNGTLPSIGVRVPHAEARG